MINKIFSNTILTKQYNKKHASVPNSKVIENKVFVLSSIFYFSIFFFLFWTTFSGSSFLFFFCFFFPKVTGSACIYIFSVFKLFFYFLSLSGQLLILCLLLLSIAYEYSSFLFLFCFKISWAFFPKPKLLLIQPTKFPHQNNSKSESPEFSEHIQWDYQNSAHILIISKPLFPNIFCNKNLIAPFQGELTKYPSASSDTKQKKNLSLSCSVPMARLFETILVDTGQKKAQDITPIYTPIVGINKTSTKPGLIPSAPKISIP